MGHLTTPLPCAVPAALSLGQTGFVCHHGYKRVVHGRFLCGEGFEGRTAAQQRGKGRDLEVVLVQKSFFLITTYCSFNRLYQWTGDLGIWTSVKS